MELLKTAKTNLCYIGEKQTHKFKPLEDRTGEEDVAGKIVVITGANAGLGYQVAKQMAARKAIVVMACRDTQKAEKVAEEIKQQVGGANLILVKLDLGDLDSVRECAKEICEKVPHINILINNAGIMATTSEIKKCKSGFEVNMGTNHLGHFLFTLSLLNHVKKGAPSRIVTLSSIASFAGYIDPEDLNMEKKPVLGISNMQPYNNSKLALAIFSRDLSKRLEGTGINTYAVCPGIVSTGIADNMGRFEKMGISMMSCTPEQGAETSMYCALAEEVAQDSGKFYHFGHYWKEADKMVQKHEDVSEKLWQASEQLVGFKFSDYPSRFENLAVRRLINMPRCLNSTAF